MAESKKQTVLSYTEKELAAIEILKANKGTPKTAQDLGIATGTLTSLLKKAEKVANGELEIHDTPVFNVRKDKVEREVTTVKEVTVYCAE